MNEGLHVVVTRAALKDLRSLPASDRTRVLERLAAYAQTPNSPGHDVIKLVGTDAGYRLRVGEWRVLFVLMVDTLDVLRVGHRREVYR